MAKNKKFTPPDLTMDDVNENGRLAEAGGPDLDGDGTDIQDDDQDETPKKKKAGRPPKKKELEAAAPRTTKPIEIRAGALKDDIYCHFSYDHNLAPSVQNKIGIKSEVLIHPDMTEAFARLNPHLALIFRGIREEDLDMDDLPKDERDPIFIKLKEYTVNGFKLIEYGDEESVVLIGSEELPTGPAHLETPQIYFTNSKYSEAGRLRLDLNALIFEIEEYLHGRKKADDLQGSLF